MTTDIPPLRPPEQLPPVRTQADLHEHWRRLMGPLGFSREQLWFQLLDADGRCLPVLPKLEDPPALPDQEGLDTLLGICGDLLAQFAPDGRVAFLWARPGRAGLRTSDRAWATALLETAHRLDVALAPVHLANDDEIRPWTADDGDDAGAGDRAAT